MAEITAASVKELRERTGAGMMDCKKALAENQRRDGSAIDWLRAKGLAAAAKKAGRTAAEGLVGVAVDGTSGAVVEVNSETDFVAKNEQFQDFVRNVARLALEHGERRRGAQAPRPIPSGGTVAEKLTDNIATIGENQSLRRAAVLEVGQGAVVSYVHNAGRAGPRQDRRAGRARKRGAGRDACRRSASRSRCTSPPPTRWRSTPRSFDADADRARARDRDGKGEGKRQAAEHRREDGRRRDRQVPQGECAADRSCS